jgi:hypothetical protein
MKKAAAIFFFLSVVLSVNAQTGALVTNLQSPLLDENSGLIFYNNNLITHTDSGGEAKLYEINTTTGAVSRTVVVNNATNVDWEDIAQDATHIYIADIGNNSGNRTDLKVYKILKSDYNDADNMVSAEIIAYSYANQTSFTANVNNNNWDAEGLISYNDKLLIFSKNWANNTVDVYSIPKTTNQMHSAVLESSFNTNGLVTGAAVSADGSVIFLTGYSSSAAPFMFTIHNIPSATYDVFSGSVSQKITNIVPLGNQIEAIALFEITPTKHRLYLSNEKFVTFIGPIPFAFPAKLWTIEINNDTILLGNADLDNDFGFTIFPNPVGDLLQLNKKVDELLIYDISGLLLAKELNVSTVSVQHLSAGVYMVHSKIGGATMVRKIIKK